MSTDIWVLSDNRVGNANQAIALAEELGLSYEVKNVKYNIFGNLPNFIFALRPIHIKSTTFKQFDLSSPPRIIISSGRRTAPLALYLKRRLNGKVKIIQIMKPDSALNNFDLVVLPQHDNLARSMPNVARTIGALSNIRVKLDIKRDELRKHYPEVKNFIAVIIGGDSKNYRFSDASATAFCKYLSKVSDNHSTPLFISFSRRTSASVQKIIRNNFSWPHVIYDPNEPRPNPYFVMLSQAEFVISTADSISMCSEAGSSGKPLYIFCPDDFTLKKHRFFIQQLLDLGIARKFDESTVFLEKYSYQPLNEVKKIAEIIKSQILGAH